MFEIHLQKWSFLKIFSFLEDGGVDISSNDQRFCDESVHPVEIMRTGLYNFVT